MDEAPEGCSSIAMQKTSDENQCFAARNAGEPDRNGICDPQRRDSPDGAMLSEPSSLADESKTASWQGAELTDTASYTEADVRETTSAEQNRRVNSEASSTPEPRQEGPTSNRPVLRHSLKSPKSPKRHRRWRRKSRLLGVSYERWTSILAVLVLILAVILALSQDTTLGIGMRSRLPNNVAEYISTLPSFRDMALYNYIAFSNLTDIKLAALINAGIPNLPHITENLSMLGVGITNIGQSLGNSVTFRPQNMLALVQPFQFPRPGIDLKSQGFKPKHPVLIVPGFVTSGLELWETLPCASQQKRERVWGSWAMTSGFLLNKECWLKHLRLDERTGLDPAGVKVRASQGLEAVDYFLPGYHVWARMIEAFADFGYDNNNLVTESYDWRLSPPKLQQRDGYFTKLKLKIMMLVQLHGEKVVVVSHSWGDTIFRIFLSWVSATEPYWVHQHIETYANIAGPTLGVPKAVSSLLSGETRDTAELGYVVSMLINNHFTRAQRVGLFRSWGAGLGMLPLGGPEIWGNSTWAPDDTEAMRTAGKSYGPMISLWESSDAHAEAAERSGSRLVDTFGFKIPSLRHQPDNTSQGQPKQLDVSQSLELLVTDGTAVFKENARKMGGIGDKSRDIRCAASLSDDQYSFSPLECPLPNAPQLKMFCIYGVGHETERAYHYEHFKTQKAFDMAKREASRQDADPTELDVRYKLNPDAHDPKLKLDDGIWLADGDGTVPLVSLGALCRKHWKSPKLNAHNVTVITREYQHEPLIGTYSPLNPIHRYQQLTSFSRGGPRSADHIDILSHEDVLRDVLKMSAGHAAGLQDQVSSDIDSIVQRIPADQ